MTTKRGSKTVKKTKVSKAKTSKVNEIEVKKEKTVKDTVAKAAEAISKMIEENKGIEMGKVSAKSDEKKVSKPVTIKRSDSVFSNAIASVATHKGIRSDVEKLEKELKRQKSFSKKAIGHFKEVIIEKNEMVDSLREENAILRKQIKMLYEKNRKDESLADKLLLDHFRNEDFTKEDEFDNFINDLKNIWT